MAGLRDQLNPKCEVLGAPREMPKPSLRPRTSLNCREPTLRCGRIARPVHTLCEGNKRRETD